MATSSPSAITAALPAFLTQERADLHAKFVDLEWHQRERLQQGLQAADPPSQWTRLSGDVVTARNRYLNVEPFASNRIKLQLDGEGNDYINASPIQLGNRKYIATQGPKQTGINHFYRMVAAETKNPAVVVMLTQTHEAGKEKCFPYYPLSEEESPLEVPLDNELSDEFKGEVTLVNVQEDSSSRSQIRHLKFKRTSGSEQPDEKDIYHVLFSGWPDFLVPEGEDRAALLELLRVSASLGSPPSDDKPSDQSASGLAAQLESTDPENPRIIHCSAGVGRSGTFIALDYLLSLMYAGGLDTLPADRDPIAETVDSLRQQRMMMVQGEAQFNFLYDVLREQFEARIQSRGNSEELSVVVPEA